MFYISEMKKRVLYHVLFWLVYFLWGSYVTASYDGKFYRAFMNEVIQLPLKISVTYFMMYYLLPKYVITKKYQQLFFIFSLLVICSTLVFRLTMYTIIQPRFYPESEIHFWNYGRILWGVFEIFSVAAIALSIKLYKSKYEDMQREQELEKEKLKTELSFLKAQINPHFLFNTLNNIYALSLKNSPQTANSILKLSELLRFMVHDSSMQKIKLTDEIKIMNDYIELEQLRYGNRLSIVFETDSDNPNEMIAPLLLLPFVENSFKHGASEARFNSSINISLKLKKSILTFKVINTKEDEKYNENGIGLKNIRRQLELIYGKSHELEINNSAHLFEAYLKINLAEHAKAELLNN